MQSTLLVMAGGAVGAALRFPPASGTGERWPLATLTVNLVAALGFAMARGLAT
jgi:fluoride ion exporter CrcB/FEX